MAEEWIVRVQGKEYGPVDFETLSEWKREGRVLPTNEVRKVDVDLWTTAAQIPDLFPPVEASAVGDELAQTRSLHDILVETWRIYGKGFWQFLGLSALVAVPSICAQLSSTALGSPSNLELDLRTFLAALFNLTMLLLSLAAWPLYIAGIQILTSELAAGRSVAIVDLVQRALKFWPRVAVLWVVVAISYFFWTVLPIAVILVIAVGSPSLFSICEFHVLATVRRSGRLGFHERSASKQGTGAQPARSSLVSPSLVARRVFGVVLVRARSRAQRRPRMVRHPALFPGLGHDARSTEIAAILEREFARF